MTTELEEQFFKVFGVEKKCQCKNFVNYADCFRIHTECKEYSYPKITDRQLLQMICIINEFISMLNWKQIKYISTFEIETLKENILKDLIWILSNECNDVTKKQLKHQIRQLFKEEE